MIESRDATTLVNDPQVVALFPNRYLINSVIHQGIYSILYSGYDKVSNENVVLKCFDTDHHSHYLREIAAAFGLSHSHLVRCIDAFYLLDNRSCIVYEFITGGALSTYLQTQGPLRFEQLLKCLQDMLKALIYLHQHGCIHCDIKPANIFLRPNPNSVGDFNYVLGDLGAACFIKKASQGAYATGSPAYTAPERLHDRFLYNSDLYSLGILGYELLTGSLPFSGSVNDIIRAHFSKHAEFGKIKHPALRDFLESLLEKDPHSRIPDAKTALQLLQQLPTSAAESNLFKPASNHQLQIAELEKIYTRDSKWSCTAKKTLQYKPLNLLSLYSNNHYFVVLQFKNHIEVIDTADNTTTGMTLVGNKSQLVNEHQFAYTTSSRLFLFDISSHNRYCLAESCEKLVAFTLAKDRLLWRDSLAWHFCHLDGTALISCRTSHYLLSPQSHILSQNMFLISEGTMNHKLSWRDNAGQVLQTWTLDGPILALTAAQDIVIALTLDTSESECYSIWRLSLAEKPQQVQLSEHINKCYCLPGYIFMQHAKSNSIWIYDTNLNYSYIDVFSNPLNLFSISHNCQFISTVNHHNHETYELALWERQN